MKKLLLTIAILTLSVTGFAQSPTDAPATPPDREATDVISIFSDAYTDIQVGTFSADFDDSDISDTTIAGNAVKRIDFGNFIGVDFQNNRQDMSGMTHFHMDFWTAETNLDGKVFNSKFSQWGGGAGEVSAFALNINTGTDPAIQTGTWVSIDVPIASFSNNPAARDDVAQFLITSNLDVVYVDNIYVYNDGSGTGGGGNGGGPLAEIFTEGFDAAASVDGWTSAGDAAGRASEVTLEWAETAGVDGSGAFRFGGVNADGQGGRAYIIEKVFTDVDFGGATSATVSFAIKSEVLAGTNISVLTDINGSIAQNASITSMVSDQEFTTITLDHETIPETANSVKYQFNLAAGAEQGLGGTVLFDDLKVLVEGTADPSIGAFSLISPADGANVTLEGDPETPVSISWTGDSNPSVTYMWHVDAPGNDFSSPLLSLPSDNMGADTVLSLNFQALDNALASLGVQKNTPTDLIWTVTAMAADSVRFADEVFNITLTRGTLGFTGDGNELLTNGDFEAGNDGSWYGNALNVQEDGGNSFNFANVAAAGNPFDVNLSQLVTLTASAKYVLTFDASGSGNGRSLVVGIGQSVSPFLSDVTTVNIADSIQTYSLTFDAIDANNGEPFGGSETRVIFDMGADTGVVVIDNVSLQEAVASSNEEIGDTPSEFVLNQNYPNPFNPSTNISFTIPQAERITLKVYDMLGREVAVLADRQLFNAGTSQVTFNARNLSSGVYIYQLQTSNMSLTRKMTLIK